MSENIFWDKVSGASRFLADAADCLIEGSSVMLDFDGDVPWEGSMLTSLTDRLNACLDSRTVDVFSVAETTDPGKFLLESYYSEAERDKYWPTKSEEKFMAGNPNSPLHRRFVVLTDIPYEMDEAWTSCVDDYVSGFSDGEEHALFVLVTKRAKSSCSSHIKLLNYDEYISEYDCLILCMNILSDLKLNCSDVMKKYLAELAVQLADGQIERAGMLADYGISLAMDPGAVLRSVTNAGRSEAFDDFVRVNVWEAQVRIIFPELEKFKRSFIRKYGSVLEIYLPIRDSYGEETTEVGDLELGQLVRICATYTSTAEKPDYDKLIKHKNARNQIAHENVIRFDELENLGIV